MDYMLYYKEEGTWVDCGGLFKNEDEVKEEIKAYQKFVPTMKTEDFAIVPNDGESWKKYRPLDTGDRIFQSDCKR